MSDKKDEINNKNKKDWSKVERTPDLVDYVYDKYGNVPVTDEMLDDLYNYAMMKIEKYLSMVEFEKKVESLNAIEKIYKKLMVTDDMIKYEKDDKGKGKVDDVEGDLAREKQARDDVDLVDADDVDLVDSLDLENRVKKLKGDFSRLLKAKKAKEAKEAEEAEVKVNKVVQVSSDEGFSGDEDVVYFNDVKYPLIDAEIRMFKETPTASKGPRRQLASTSTRSRALIASTTSRGPRCVLALFAPNALPPFPL
ncbi:hypothetical protein Tco_0793948 [Tanacetum coccineum]